MRQQFARMKKSPYVEDERKIRGCLTFAGEIPTHFINRHARAHLLWLFWHSFTQWPYYEDPDLPDDFFPALTTRKNWIPYCETKIIRNRDKANRRSKYPQNWRISPDRLDY